MVGYRIVKTEKNVTIVGYRTVKRWENVRRAGCGTIRLRIMSERYRTVKKRKADITE